MMEKDGILKYSIKEAKIQNDPIKKLMCRTIQNILDEIYSSDYVGIWQAPTECYPYSDWKKNFEEAEDGVTAWTYSIPFSCVFDSGSYPKVVRKDVEKEYDEVADRASRSFFKMYQSELEKMGIPSNKQLWKLEDLDPDLWEEFLMSQSGEYCNELLLVCEAKISVSDLEDEIGYELDITFAFTEQLGHDDMPFINGEYTIFVDSESFEIEKDKMDMKNLKKGFEKLEKFGKKVVKF